MPCTVLNARGKLIAVTTVCLIACAAPPNDPLISYERALEISRATAKSSGYDLNEYTLDTYGDPSAAGEGEWLIGYNCEPPGPGCHFLVVVDRTDGSSRIIPGE